MKVTGDLRENNFNRRIGALVQLPQNEKFIGKKWKSQRKAILWRGLTMKGKRKLGKAIAGGEKVLKGGRSL